MRNFLEQMESGYSKYRNPYHNLLHAADVLQTTYQIIYNSGLMVEVNGVSLSLFCFVVPAPTLASSSVLHVHTALHRRNSSDTLPLSLLRCLRIFIELVSLQNWLSDYELFAMFIAAIIHDFEHTGTSNNFHVQSRLDTDALLSESQLRWHIF